MAMNPLGPTNSLSHVNRSASLPPPPVTAKPDGGGGEVQDQAEISQVPTKANGVKFNVSQDVVDGQKLVAVQAVLPAVPLLGAETSIALIRDADTGQVVEAKALQGEDELKVIPDAQGNMFITTGQEGSPWLYVDANPQSESFLKYGLTTESKAGPGGTQHREMQEYVSPDGTSTVIANEVVYPNGHKDYLRIDHSPQEGTYAAKVEDRGGTPVEAKNAWSSDGMTQTWKAQWEQMGSWVGKGGTWKETALKVNPSQQGLVLTTDASDADQAKAARRSAADPSVSWGKRMLTKYVTKSGPEVVASVMPWSFKNQLSSQAQAPPPAAPQGQGQGLPAPPPLPPGLAPPTT